jgi:hypothetical protein
MKKNNDFIELESNSKRSRVEVNLTNMPEDPMGDQWMNDCLITYIFKTISNKEIMQQFQGMKTCR